MWNFVTNRIKINQERNTIMTKYNESERCVYFDMTDVLVYMERHDIKTLNFREMEEMFYQIAIDEVMDHEGRCELIADEDYAIEWISELQEDEDLRKEFDGFLSDNKVPMTLDKYLEVFGHSRDYMLLFDRQRRFFTMYSKQAFAEMIGLNFTLVSD